MRVLALEINGFRGIPQCRLVLPKQVAIIGPNGSGKSTIIDALSLVFGRQKLVRVLTEHDFPGSRPRAEDRIRIVATVGGFSPNDHDKHHQWFRQGRAVPKWWNPSTDEVGPVEPPNGELCVQIGYAARFDRGDLEVKHRRYFHDDEEQVDPFDDDHVARFPDRLLQEIGFFVLPARRTWTAIVSFTSELFRKAVATVGGIPSDAILDHVERLRMPDTRLEDQKELKPLIEGINGRLSQLLRGSPKLQLRVTSTDSESLLGALVPHYECEGQQSLPAGRHGTGLISLQTLALLLEIGKARKEGGQSCILALEEPELHVPPGLQRRLIADAASVSDQIITTTHAPRVAAFFEPSSTQILFRVEKGGGARRPYADENHDDSRPRIEGRALTPSTMMDDVNALVQLFTDARIQLLEALMFPAVLVPEGRVDFEWLRLLLDVAETGSASDQVGGSHIPPFGSIVGVVPTRSSSVQATYSRLADLHPNVRCLVDGDRAGAHYIKALASLPVPPRSVLRWPDGQTVEDVLGWVLDGEQELLSDINTRLGSSFNSVVELVHSLKEKDGAKGGLKNHYIAHEEIASSLKRSCVCVVRIRTVLEAVTRAVLLDQDGFDHLILDEACSTESCSVYRFVP